MYRTTFRALLAAAAWESTHLGVERRLAEQDFLNAHFHDEWRSLSLCQGFNCMGGQWRRLGMRNLTLEGRLFYVHERVQRLVVGMPRLARDLWCPASRREPCMPERTGDASVAERRTEVSLSRAVT